MSSSSSVDSVCVSWQPSFSAFDIQAAHSVLPAYTPVLTHEHNTVTPHQQSEKEQTQTKSTLTSLSQTAGLVSATSSFDFYEPLKLDNLRETLIRLEESVRLTHTHTA